MLNKTSKIRKSIMAIIAAILLLFTAYLSIILTTIETRIPVNAEKAQSVSLYAGGINVKNTELRSGSVCVSQTITATITPATVADKYVTWEIGWASDAPLKNTDISEYLEVTEESQGKLTATVNCYKAFRGSKAILTCTARQGNKKGTCEVIYEGVPSSASINSPTNAGTFNLGRDTVDLLLVGQLYSMNLSLDNVFHDAGSGFSDYEVTVSGAGSVTCGNYSRSPRGAGWSSHSNTVNFADIAHKFVSASVTDNVLNVQITKSLYDYYESSETHHVEGNGETTNYTNKLYSLNVDADGNLPYFIMTVRHRTLGFSAQYRFFITDAIENVQTNKQAITF